MSHQLTVAINRNSIPEAELMNQELRRLGLPCKVASDASFHSVSGSFEATATDESRSIQFEESDWLEEDSRLKRHAGERDRCIDLLLGSDMVECGLVTAIGAALSSIAGAVVYCQPDELLYTAEEAVAESKSALEL